MLTTVCTTFQVSQVRRASAPLPEVPYKAAIETLLTQPGREKQQSLAQTIAWVEKQPRELDDTEESREGWDDNEEWLRKKRQVLADIKAAEAAARAVEACSRYHGRLVAEVLAHPVIVALHRAFMQHRPLGLSPDMIWLLICQGVANHVNVNSDELRPKVVRHSGRIQIEVRRDDFIKGSPENPWENVFAEFSTRIREQVGPTHDLFIPRFTTTGLAERAAAEVVLMDAMRSYFDYHAGTLCGIPSITLEGNTQDWQTLADRAQRFAEFGLDWWLSPLAPVLQQFVAAAGGDVDVDFWRSIYKYQEHSGGASVTGWIASFFPYLKDQSGAATLKNRWLDKATPVHRSEEDEESWDMDMGWSGPSPGKLPSGLVRVPFVWQFLDRRFAMEFLAGFVGVAQDHQTLTLRPEIGWAVRETAG